MAGKFRPIKPKKQLNNNFFTQEIQKNGEDFLERLTPDQLDMNSQRIIRELCKGRVNYSKMEPYLMNTQLLNTLVRNSYAYYQEYNSIVAAYDTTIYFANMYEQPINPMVTQYREKYFKKMQVYYTVNNYLYAFSIDHDISNLVTMTNIIQSSRLSDYI